MSEEYSVDHCTPDCVCVCVCVFVYEVYRVSLEWDERDLWPAEVGQGNLEWADELNQFLNRFDVCQSRGRKVSDSK